MYRNATIPNSTEIVDAAAGRAGRHGAAGRTRVRPRHWRSDHQWRCGRTRHNRVEGRRADRRGRQDANENRLTASDRRRQGSSVARTQGSRNIGRPDGTTIARRQSDDHACTGAGRLHGARSGDEIGVRRQGRTDTWRYGTRGGRLGWGGTLETGGLFFEVKEISFLFETILVNYEDKIAGSFLRVKKWE